MAASSARPVIRLRYHQECGDEQLHGPVAHHGQAPKVRGHLSVLQFAEEEAELPVHLYLYGCHTAYSGGIVRSSLGAGPALEPPVSLDVLVHQ